MSRTNRTRASRFEKSGAVLRPRSNPAMLRPRTIAATIITFTFAILLCIVCSIARLSAPSNALADEATAREFAPIVKDASANAANLVLIVEFSDAPEQNYYDLTNADDRYPTNMTNLQVLLEKLNGIDAQSYRSYFRTVSKGEFNVMSYVPQAYADGTCMRIKLDISSSEYLNASDYSAYDATIVKQAVDQLNAARPDLDASILSFDSEGYIDNLLVIMCTNSTKEITAHETEQAGSPQVGLGTAARKVGSVTFVNGGGFLYSIPGNTFSRYDKFNASVAAHERMHTFDVRDLYRSSDKAGIPVGIWDIMAKGGQYSWPLAYTRQCIGWIDIPTFTPSSASDIVTLYAPAQADDKANSKPQAFVLKTSYSESEYFVIEYRKKEDSAACDSNIPSSGLIVYRVNETLSDKKNTDTQDFIYVFRPGETGLLSSAGDIEKAAICSQKYAQDKGLSNPSSIGSLDANAQIADGAICYSNGKNSGLKITAVTQTDNSISVRIEQKLSDDVAGWAPVLNANGTSPISGIVSPTVKIAGNGSTPYLLVEDMAASTANAKLLKHDGSNWTQVGSSLVSIRNIDMLWFNGSLYAIGAPTNANASSTSLLRLNGQKWESVATVPKTYAYAEPKLAAINGKLYVLTCNASGLTIYELNGSSLTQYGATIAGSGFTRPALLSVAGKPAVLTGSTAAKWSTDLYTPSSDTWTKRTLFDTGAASVISTTTIGTTTYAYVYYSDHANLLAFDGTGKQTLNREIAQLSGASAGAKLVANGKNLYLCAGTSGDGSIVYELKNASPDAMSALDGPAYAKYYGIDACVIGNDLFVAVADESARTVAVRKHSIAASAVTPNPGSSSSSKPSSSASSKPSGSSSSSAKPSGSTSAKPSASSSAKPKPSSNASSKPSSSAKPNGSASTKPGSSSKPSASTGSSSTRKQVMYRLYNPNSGEHFYTASSYERDSIVRAGWKYEGVGWTAPAKSNVPVYRLYNPNAGDHHYTTSSVERDSLVRVGWKYEGIGWYSDDQRRVPLYRQYNPNATTGTHNYTTSSVERKSLISNGWKDERIGWYGL